MTAGCMSSVSTGSGCKTPVMIMIAAVFLSTEVINFSSTFKESLLQDSRVTEHYVEAKGVG